MPREQLNPADEAVAVVISGDLRGLTESLNRTAHSLRQFSKPLEQVTWVAQQFSKPLGQIAQQVCNKKTIDQWAVVKPILESAPAHEKRRLGSMTIGEAFAFYARRAAAGARPNLANGRVQRAARTPRGRPVRSRAKARSPGSRSGSDDPHPLGASPSSLASAGLFCVPACGASPPLTPPAPVGRGRSEEVAR